MQESLVVLDDGFDQELEVQARLRDTLELRRCVVTLTALTDQEGAPGAIVCVSDTTESARLREELRVQATFDALTGCYNRASIMTAVERALANGVGLGDVLTVVAAFREQDANTPVVLMGYANPIEAMGVKAFADRAQKAGVDGVIVVDYPPEEAVDFTQLLEERGIAPIFLLAPTTPEARIIAIGRMARGYVYYVSLKGVTVPPML